MGLGRGGEGDRGTGPGFRRTPQGGEPHRGLSGWAAGPGLRVLRGRLPFRAAGAGRQTPRVDAIPVPGGAARLLFEGSFPPAAPAASAAAKCWRSTCPPRLGAPPSKPGPSLRPTSQAPHPGHCVLGHNRAASSPGRALWSSLHHPAADASSGSEPLAGPASVSLATRPVHSSLATAAPALEGTLCSPVQAI